MSRVLIRGGDVFCPNEVVHSGVVLVENSRIVQAGPMDPFQDLPDTEVVDASGLWVVPGFIDLQVNGAAGRLFTDDPTIETLRAMSKALCQTGCTAFVPTVISAPLEQMQAAAGSSTVASRAKAPGAQVLGCHFEGPFLSSSKAGAHRPQYIRAPSLPGLRLLLGAAGALSLMTLAPELPDAGELVAEAASPKTIVALGHSEVSYEQVAAAARAGASLATHLFNAMPPLAARAPGLVGAALDGVLPFASIIADGVHVHPANLKRAVQALGAGRLALITDGMPPIGTDIDDFYLQGRQVLVRDGACYLEDGMLAGSVLTMNKAVRNMRDLVGVSDLDAVTMAAATPARVLGIDNRTGSLAPGMDADLVVCDDDFNVLLTMVRGRIMFRGPSFEAAAP